MTCIPTWTPILTFSTFAGLAASGNTTLTIAKAFTSYSLLILIITPVTQIIIALPMVATAVTSFQRIQDYMTAAERQDNRLSTGNDAHSQNNLPFVRYAGTGVSAPESHELQAMKPRTSGLDVNIASITGKFSWAEDAEPILDLEQWDIRRNAFTLVLGPVGCGKTTLLKAILGELSSFKGTIKTSYSGIAYCSQNAWIPNETVRDIITGGDDLDALWYDRVLKACALDHDVVEWPNGDETIVGTGGISMSGGQKHRIVSTLT